MSEQEHIQKKSPNELSQSEHSRFSTRGFAEQIGQDIASKQPQDIKTQLSRAERFGHNLSKIPVPTSSPPPVAVLQTKVSALGGGNQAIQRAELEKDDELQMKSEPVRDSGFGSMLSEIGSIYDPSMDLNTYKTLNQHVEFLLPQLQQQSLLPQLQGQVMQQSTSGDTQNTMQLARRGGRGQAGGQAGGGGSSKGGKDIMGKLDPMSKILGK